MKYAMILCLLLFIACERRMEGVSVKDYGKQQIGDGLYLKKLYVNDNDRVYLLVDENDKLISTTVNTSYTVRTGKTSYVESNAFIQR